MVFRGRRCGFTLIELLVVVAIIVVLIAMLAPALEKAMEAAMRAKCAANLHAMGIGSREYTLMNKGEYFSIRGREVGHNFNGGPIPRENGHSAGHGVTDSDHQVDWVEAMSTVGLASQDKMAIQYMRNNNVDPPRVDTPIGYVDVGNLATVQSEEEVVRNEPSEFWDCPSTPNLSRWVANGNVLAVTYYSNFGRRNWWNKYTQPNNERRKDRAPIARSSETRPGWVTVHDWTYRTDGNWHVNHGGGVSGRPAGSNQLYVDGGAAWAPGEKLFLSGAWYPNRRQWFVYQNDTGDYQSRRPGDGSDNIMHAQFD